MKLAAIVILSMTLVSGVAFAADPEIRIIDGKVSISADAVPLGLLLSLFDRATGLKSEVKAAELANRSISVRFTDLELKHAVRKIFEGQPVNYMFIEGKGVRVTEASQPGTGNVTALASSPSPVQPSGQFPNIQPQFPVSAPVGAPATPVGLPFNAPGGASAVVSGNPSLKNGPIPGQIAPPMGSSPPLGSMGEAAAPTGIPPPVSMPPGPYPGTPGYKPPEEPAGPGTLGGVIPGVIK